MHPRTLLENRTQQLDERAVRLSRALAQWLTVQRLRFDRLLPRHPGERVGQQRQRLEAAGRLLDAVSYQGTLERGFVLAFTPDGHPVPRAAGAPPHLRLRFADGDVQVTRTELA